MNRAHGQNERKGSGFVMEIDIGNPVVLFHRDPRAQVAVDAYLAAAELPKNDTLRSLHVLI